MLSNGASELFITLTPWPYTSSSTGEGLYSTVREIGGVYIFYGALFCLCVLIGTSGNLVSFIYFKSKKRSISNTIYMFITANDLLVSMTAIPLALSDSSQDKDLMISMFGNTSTDLALHSNLTETSTPMLKTIYTTKNNQRCAVWILIWQTTINFSVFLTTCLSVSRTISLLDPFRRQKVKYLVSALVVFAFVQMANIFSLHFFIEVQSTFNFWNRRCEMFVYHNVYRGTEVLILKINFVILFVTPAFVVAISCVISALVLLLAKRKTKEKHRVLESSRNKATITILLFTLLYGVCNVPLVVEVIFKLFDLEWYESSYQFDGRYHYRNAAEFLLLAVNSAANPIFYFWRMPALRETVKAGIRGMFEKPEPGQGRNRCDILMNDSTGTQLINSSRLS